MVSMFQLSSRVRNPASENRATPMMRLEGTARLAMRAMVGPTLPPIPRNIISPSTCLRSSGSQTGGRDKSSSSISSVSMVSGR